MDLFEKIIKNIPASSKQSLWPHGSFTYPKLEEETPPYTMFKDTKYLSWSTSDYLGLSNDPEIREEDISNVAKFGLNYPSSTRMASGNAMYHEQLEQELALFVEKEGVFLLNSDYEGLIFLIESLVDDDDVVLYDIESNAAIKEGILLHKGKCLAFVHNDMEDCRKQLLEASGHIQKTGGGILLITEGIFAMSGVQGKLREIVELKNEFKFRLLVDDTHGFGVMGTRGHGTPEEQFCMHEVDIYFASFAHAMAGIGAFVASTSAVTRFLQYNLRSQLFSKSLPLSIVKGCIKRLDIVKNRPELRKKLSEIVKALQSGLKGLGFNLGATNTMITPVFLNGELSESIAVGVELREVHHIFCSLIVYPTALNKQVELRLIPTVSHSLEDVQYTLKAFLDIALKLSKGYFQKRKIVV